jgi:hypothetical protein
MKSLHQDNQPSEYKAELLTIWLYYFININVTRWLNYGYIYKINYPISFCAVHYAANRWRTFCVIRQ